jgi:hypothetical protein
LLATVIRGGKTMANGKMGYCASVRHRTAELCPHGLLARYLCHRFTVRGEQFPLPNSPDEMWFHTALWKGNNPRANISYEQQAKAFRAVFKLAEILCGKLTHAPRISGAQFLDAHGVDDTVRLLISCVVYMDCMVCRH